MPQPERQDIFNEFDRLSQRIDRLERSTKLRPDNVLVVSLPFVGITIVDNAGAVNLASYTITQKGMYVASGTHSFSFVTAGRQTILLTTTGSLVMSNSHQGVISTLAARAQSVAIGPVILLPGDTIVLQGSADSMGGNVIDAGSLRVGGILLSD